MTITALLTARNHDLGGGFVVRRLLPAADRQSIGPFLFFDHFGPVTVRPSDNHDVRPHPHIGLATVTYLFDGAILHHDSLGYRQRIEPGAINWMTAGRGIAHSERRPPDLADKVYVNHGIQLWAALPRSHEEVPPAFHHQPADTIPRHQAQGIDLRVLVGSLAIDGKQLSSPVPTLVDTLYLDIVASAGHRFVLPAADRLADGSLPQRAVYPIDQPIAIDGQTVAPGTLAVLEDGASATIETRPAADPDGAAAGNTGRYLVIGGAAIDGHRFIFWNFVSSSKERISQAADQWQAHGFDPVPGETERIELPARKL